MGGTAVSLATGGHFSHVAFLYKDPNDLTDIVYYEAVSDGVGHTWWSECREHVGPGKFYEKVCFRKLTIKRDEKFMSEIENFVSATYGMEYSLKSIFPGQRRSSINVKIDKDGKKKYVAEDRTFFCSEYVAKAYKVLGVFDTQENSSFFLPSTLEKDEFLEMADGVTLGPITNIVLDE